MFHWLLHGMPFANNVQRRRRKRGHQRRGKDRPHRVELAVGMKVMVTDNVETDLDITNGARGEIVGIVLHPDEATIDKNQAIVKLIPTELYPCQALSHKSHTTGGFGKGDSPH